MPIGGGTSLKAPEPKGREGREGDRKGARHPPRSNIKTPSTLELPTAHLPQKQGNATPLQLSN